MVTGHTAKYQTGCDCMNTLVLMNCPHIMNFLDPVYIIYNIDEILARFNKLDGMIYKVLANFLNYIFLGRAQAESIFVKTIN